MKLVLFTDNLGSGGAQRQLCLLAFEFQRLGHTVSVLTYNSDLGEEGKFFLPWLDSRSIAHQQLRVVRRWQRPFELRRVLAATAPDAVLAFQEASSLYAELAGILGRRWGLVVSERTADPGSSQGLRSSLRLAHRWADYVAANSMANCTLIQSSFGCRRLDIQVIYNGVDFDYFMPDVTQPVTRDFDGVRPLRLVVLASHQWNKNLRNVLKAILCLHGRMAVHLKWYGRTGEDKSPFQEGEQFIQANGLGAHVELLPPTRDPRQAYWDSDAVLLASWYEGCPNVICEAMACGKPVLASAVSDNPLIVEDGVSGFLFDPHSPDAIAASISRFAQLDLEHRRAMGTAGHQRAESLFALESCARRYEELLASASHERRKKT
jgi:glycosyltransferase involved in cell wall biosynthesis